MDWKDRITTDPETLSGKPRIKGTRISVEMILDRVADGWSTDDILASYPRVTRQDVLAALSFAAELFKEQSFVAVRKVAA
ncbi:MAG: DUF433 domain-containing protein [Burkholderiales bacterium]|nr:DUF433 domain-containing protein [Burkholderiales bacterium]